MTQRRRTSRSRSRGPRPTMAWFNNGLDPQTLSANTNVTSNLTGAHPPFPDGFQSGFTILRLLVNLAIAPSVTNAAVLGLAAIYVGVDNLISTPPNLNADLLDYYWFQELQTMPGGLNVGRQYEVDLRSARKVRGENRSLFFQMINNDLVNDLTFGLGVRMLLKRS